MCEVSVVGVEHGGDWHRLTVIRVVGDDSWRANFGVEAAGSQRQCVLIQSFYSDLVQPEQGNASLVSLEQRLLPEQLQPARRA